MIELMYCSRVSPSLELPDVYTILKQSQGRNAAAHITGILLFNTRYFLQVIEGEESQVHSLYQRIEADPRHHQVQLISRQPVTQRRWSQWSMALITPGINNQVLMRRYCGSDEFIPAQLDAANARGLLQALTHLTPPL
jgi:hypothetical protein